MTDRDQATVSVLRAVFEIVTPVGLVQPYPHCVPCVAMIGQTFCLCNQQFFLVSLHHPHRSVLWA